MAENYVRDPAVSEVLGADIGFVVVVTTLTGVCHLHKVLLDEIPVLFWQFIDVCLG